MNEELPVRLTRKKHGTIHSGHTRDVVKKKKNVKVRLEITRNLSRITHTVITITLSDTEGHKDMADNYIHKSRVWACGPHVFCDPQSQKVELQ